MPVSCGPSMRSCHASPRDWRLSIETLRAWLQQDIQRSPLASVVHRTCVIARYLDWRSTTAGGSHLLAELRAQYGRLLNPIVRALLEDDYESALQRLRPLPDWGSVLGRSCASTSRGCSRWATGTRCGCAIYGASIGSCSAILTWRPPRCRNSWRPGVTKAAVCDINCGCSSADRYCRRRCTEGHDGVDPADRGRAASPGGPARAAATSLHRGRDPEAARCCTPFPSHNAPLRSIALHAMITLAYCAGLRLGEIVSLTLGDLDLEGGLLEIRDTKFFKSRRLPLAPSAISVLSAYLDARAAAGAPSAPEAPMWWSPLRRQGYSYGTTEKLLVRVFRRAGLKPEQGQRGPRVHDLRHSFVGHRMMQWYRDGVDPQTRLPHLVDLPRPQGHRLDTGVPQHHAGAPSTGE